MAKNSSDHLTYILEIGAQHLEFLGSIRNWVNLAVASESDLYWVKGLTPQQIESAAIKTIPFKEIYYLEDFRLFPYGSKLPVKKLPSALLWTPIARALPVQMPAFNHNYFGISGTLAIGLIPSEKEQEPCGLLTPLDLLASYVLSAPSIRLKNLQWVIREEMAFILGAPLLPIPGDTYWRKGDFLLPTGTDFDFPALAEVLEGKINESGIHWIVWQRDATYFPIHKGVLRQLSLSSVRLSRSSSILNPLF